MSLRFDQPSSRPIRDPRRVKALRWLLAVSLAATVAGCGSELDTQTQPSSPVAPDVAAKIVYPAVEAFSAAADAFTPSVIHLNWSEPVATPGIEVVGYEVGVNALEPITSVNWSSTTTLLGTLTHSGSQYSMSYDDSSPNLTAGDVVWVAVRARYNVGLLGAVGTVVQLRVTEPAYVSGTVIDDTGAPLAGVDVVTIPGYLRSTTNAQGAYSVGPVSDEATIVLQTESNDVVSAPGADDAWYDYFTDPIAVGDGEPVGITLLTRYDIATASGATTTWSTYIRHAVGSGLRSWKWRTPELKVYVPDITITVDLGEAGVYQTYLGEQMRAAMSIWNNALGRVALVETADESEAQIICKFYGWDGWARMTRIDPLRQALLSVPPNVVGIEINSEHDDMFRPENAAKLLTTCVHELGHALGHDGHSFPHLYDGVAVTPVMRSGLNDVVFPHASDLRALMAINSMPQGALLTSYEGSRSGFLDFPPLP